MRTLHLPLVLLLVTACAPIDIEGPHPAPDEPLRSQLVVMGTTDVHGWLLPYDYTAGEEVGFGLARLVPVIDSIRAAHPGRTALVDSGDLLQGNALAGVYSDPAARGRGEPHPVIEAMNWLAYDAAAIGNHEFNFGIQFMEEVFADAELPFLAPNIFVHGTDRPAYPQYTIIERQVEGRPLRIGITAGIPPGVLVWDRDHVLGRLDFPDLVESIRPLVPRMRAEGAEIIIVAAHNGLEGTSYDTAATGLALENRMADLAREVEGIDVIFLGHTHRELADSTINGVLITQANNLAQSLAVATLDIEHDGDRWRAIGKRGEVIRPDPKRSSAEFEAALDHAHQRTLAHVNRAIGTTPVAWRADSARVRDTPIIDFINEVQMRVTGADLSSAAAFDLDAVLGPGEITIAQVNRLYPYDNNTLRAVRITGRDLRMYLERSAEYYHPCPELACEMVTNRAVPGFNYDIVSGVDYELDLTRPVGERVTKLERDGQPIRDDDTFTLALNNYRQGGGGGFTMVAEAPIVYDEGESIRDLLIAEIERRGEIRPEDYFRESWRIMPEELVGRAYAEQN